MAQICRVEFRFSRYRPRTLSARHFPIDEASPDQLERFVKAAAKRELSYITNPEFDEDGVGEHIFSETAGLTPPNQTTDSKSKSALADLPVHLGRMCEAPLLTLHKKLFSFVA